MAYELHIRPKAFDYDDSSTHISLQHFQDAVEQLDDCRLHPKYEIVSVNAATGEEIRIGPRRPAAEVLFPGRKRWLWSSSPEWIPVFFLSGGSISFKAAFDPDDRDHPVRKIATQLANQLNCIIVGDDGETYGWQ